MLQQGEAFLLDSGNGHHLHIVLSDPQQDPAEVYVVTVTTWAHNKDQSCVLDKGDHAFIRHKSVVMYNQAHLKPASFWEECHSAGLTRPKPPAKGQLLKKLLQGAAVSGKVPKRCSAVLERQGLICREALDNA